ncbi:efflux RND transporter permease subunit [Sphingomonas sp. URHD0057]|uniref:efflux RND transporter permease subunit n=1 Tax=Sphingomonas sp. URHD0057 TaxID=1380389 RepID=UPI00056166DF|nr:efflux RND transporter permease subunit [Sphingomonas sp. URHD0057]
MSRYFIDRPIFAWVLAILACLFGLLSIRSLPVAQFPALAPPQIGVTAVYPGADATTLDKTTTQIIEQQLQGIDHLRYFASQSSSSGQVTVTLTFEQGTNPDTAQVQVNNKVQSALPLLPQEVQRQGVRVEKSSANFALVPGLYSTDNSHDQFDLADMMASKIQEPVSRINGVGGFQLFGSQYAMRIWVDPMKLNSVQLTMADVTSAVQAQNAQVSAGQLGNLPAPATQQLNATVSVQSRLQTPEEFGTIRLKTAEDGSVVRLRDVARIELGSEAYGFSAKYSGHPATAAAIRLAPGADALKTIGEVKAKIAEISKTLPPDVKVIYPWDTTPFVKVSLKQVVETLFEAMVLVFLVMFLFLQNWRATLIPTIAIPVVLLGTLTVMAIAGFSINTLTLFGMVLAIGLLVDDAIVVVENVERLIQTEGLTPKEAARKSMDEISGALIAIGTVLAAVFLPMAFFGGSTGVVYRQFSITIVSAMTLSVLVALILTPALAATLLKPGDPLEHAGNGPLARFFRWFNGGFERARVIHENGVVRMLGGKRRSALAYAAIVLVMAFLFWRLPTGFMPDEDTGAVFTLVAEPSGATLPRTDAALDHARDYFEKNEAKNIEGVFTVGGFSFAGQGQNAGIAFLPLKPWDERKGKANTSKSIADRATGALMGYRDALIISFIPPAALELGNATGFDLQLVDSGNIGHAKLTEARNMLMGMAMQDKRIVGIRPVSLEDAPQLTVDVDQDKARALGLDIGQINQTIASAWGGSYINDFIDRGRVKRVYVQVDQPYRQQPEDIHDLYVRGSDGKSMAPFTAFSNLKWANAPVQLSRYNGAPSLELQGSPAPGVSTGTAMKALEEMQAKLPPGTSLQWTGLSYEERQSSGQAPMLYGLSLLIVFLCLAALYESWLIPVAVLLVVPLGIVGAVIMAKLTGLENNIYLQVGLITTMGLGAKNAILIVEFAESRLAAGADLVHAAIEAAKLRLRPMLMTSLALVFGVLPLAIASGPGAGSQNAIGRAVVGGALSATFLAIFFVPLFFVFVQSLLRRDKRAPSTEAQPVPAE